MIITDTIGNYLIFAGIVLFIVFRFYNGKHRYVLLLAAIGFIGSRFAMKEIVVLKTNQKKETYLTFGSSFNYTFQNGNSYVIPVSSNTLINDTEDKLVVEKVEYSSYSSISSGDNIENNIDPFSYQQLANSVNYFYEEPPKTIRVKGGGTTTRFWLHK
jgi:hypothetical protein